MGTPSHRVRLESSLKFRGREEVVAGQDQGGMPLNHRVRSDSETGAPPVASGFTSAVDDPEFRFQAEVRTGIPGMGVACFEPVPEVVHLCFLSDRVSVQETKPKDSSLEQEGLAL